MPATDSPAILVARFLKANHYDRTLDAFISEAGLEPSAGSIGKDHLTIEKILEEKKVFDLSVRFEKFGAEDGEKKWSVPAPSTPTIVSTLPTSANLLHVSIDTVTPPSNNGTAPSTQYLLATTADRRLHILSADPTFTLQASLTTPHDSPILSCLVPRGGRFQTLTASMSGQIILYDHATQTLLASRRDHKKYVVKAALWEVAIVQVAHTRPSVVFLATAGWDAQINVYKFGRTAEGDCGDIGTPIASFGLPTNPETVLFAEDPDEGTLYLVVTRRDSTSLSYYRVDNSRPPLASTVVFAGSQNLAPHSNAWVAFSPSAIALCPTDPTLFAVATSSLPHMKLLLVRLLFPRSAAADAPAPATQAAQTRASLATQDREETAITLHVNTLAPQTPYSTPQVAWRPDGSGVWVNGDDGVVRGVEARTGKVVGLLKGGHEAGSKVRSIWAGWVGEGEEREEWVVSGGFDRRLVVWRVGGEEGGDGAE
ncbi:hypothetical protein MMC30_006311 [Trapelia coarctata]|nr:hypothetical protein [Trapelia coarctata]